MHHRRLYDIFSASQKENFLKVLTGFVSEIDLLRNFVSFSLRNLEPKRSLSL